MPVVKAISMPKVPAIANAPGIVEGRIGGPGETHAFK